MMTALLRRIAVVLGLLAMTAGWVYAGGLDDFEDDATRPSEHHHDSHADDDEDDDDVVGGCISSILFGDDEDDDTCGGESTHDSGCCQALFGDAFDETIGAATKASWNRVANSERSRAMGLTPRRAGEPLLPFLRIDAAFRPVDSDIHAWDFRSEAGYGPIAIQYNEIRYHEHSASDNMRITQCYGLYRLTAGSSCEIDLGVGQMTLHGNTRTTQGSVTIPILYHPRNERLGIEFRPAWADTISDYDLALLYSWQYSSLKAGYRWVNSPNYSLSGPYLGVSVRL